MNAINKFITASAIATLQKAHVAAGETPIPFLHSALIFAGRARQK
jgi:hypothetical protein